MKWIDETCDTCHYVWSACLEVHVRPEAVLVAVGLVAHRAHGLGGLVRLVVVARDVNIQTVLIFHLAVAVLAPQPLALVIALVTSLAKSGKKGAKGRSAHPDTRPCNTAQLSEGGWAAFSSLSDPFSILHKNSFSVKWSETIDSAPLAR